MVEAKVQNGQDQASNRQFINSREKDYKPESPAVLTQNDAILKVKNWNDDVKSMISNHPSDITDLDLARYRLGLVCFNFLVIILLQK